MSVSSVSTASDSSLIQQYMAKQAEAASSSSTSSTTSSSTATSISTITGDFNTFLKILTTQLECQDPLNATDTNQFTQELVQFAGVEQQINSNSKLDQIVSALNSNGITPLLNYVGKTVEAPADGEIVLQSGAANFSYTLPSAAQSVKLTVTNSAGNTIATMDGPTTAGVNRVSWDGVKADGTQMSDGTYNIKIVAVDSNGETLETSDVNVIALVSGIETASDGTTTLSLSGKKVAATDISAVYTGVTTTTSSS